MIRRIQKYGEEYIVTFPGWWLRKHHIKLGDMLQVTLVPGSKDQRHKLIVRRLPKS